MADSRSTQELIDALIEHWRFWEEHEQFYLTQLAPTLISDISKGDDVERDILRKLGTLLNDSEWNALPQLIAERRQGILRELENQRIRREAEAHARDRAAREEAWQKERQEELLRQANARRESFLRQLRNLFASDYLMAERFYKDECSGIISAVDFHKEQVEFVRSWLAKNVGGTSAHSVDDEQLAAISTVDGHVQVTARAGSGKTTTLVHRAFFLIKHCGVSPDELLLLAFNRKAALEIRRRLLALFYPTAESALVGEIERRQRDQSHSRDRSRADGIEAQAVDAVAAKGNIQLPHVMTFHALAYAIVHPEESILRDDSEGDDQGLSRAFQFVIDDHLHMPQYGGKIRELMLAHFREDWDRIVEGCYDQSKEELLRFRRSLPTESLRGEYVKSYGEKVIADFLFEHDVPYKYERNHWWNGINYRPDFTIFRTRTSGVIIEYFGLEGDPDYDQTSEEKRCYWETKQNWSLIEFSPRDIAGGTLQGFRARLQHELKANGIRCEPLSEDEIWHRVRERAIDRFTSAMGRFLRSL